MLTRAELPPAVRQRLLEYIEDKVAGLYGDSPFRLRQFKERLGDARRYRPIYDQTMGSRARTHSSAPTSKITLTDHPFACRRTYCYPQRVNCGARAWALEKLCSRLERYGHRNYEDTELGVLMELEVGHGEAEVYAGVQA